MADRNSFQELARSVDISYPIPWLIFACLSFASAIFWLATKAQGPLQWLFAILGVISFGAGLALTLYGLLIKPELLRSERYTLMQRALEVIGNDEMTPEQRQSVAGGFKMVLGQTSSDGRGAASGKDKDVV